MGQQDIPTDFPISPRKPGNGIEAHMKDYVHLSGEHRGSVRDLEPTYAR
jgi:hypothetical protein